MGIYDRRLVEARQIIYPQGLNYPPKLTPIMMLGIITTNTLAVRIAQAQAFKSFFTIICKPETTPLHTGAIYRRESDKRFFTVTSEGSDTPTAPFDTNLHYIQATAEWRIPTSGELEAEIIPDVEPPVEPPADTMARFYYKTLTNPPPTGALVATTYFGAPFKVELNTDETAVITSKNKASPDFGIYAPIGTVAESKFYIINSDKWYDVKANPVLEGDKYKTVVEVGTQALPPYTYDFSNFKARLYFDNPIGYLSPTFDIVTTSPTQATRNYSSFTGYTHNGVLQALKVGSIIRFEGITPVWRKLSAYTAETAQDHFSHQFTTTAHTPTSGQAGATILNE